MRSLLTFLLFVTALPGIYSDYCSANPCGAGKCLTTLLGYTCDCGLDGIFTVFNSLSTCVARTDYFKTYSYGLTPSATRIPLGSNLNQFFQHLSVGFSSSPGKSPSWNITRQWNWASNSPQIVSPVKEQRICKSCAAFSVTSAIESALAISNPAVYLYPPKLSEQQLLDCGALSCQGGWIGDVYDYTARMYLATDLLYPYKATSNPSDCSPLKLSLGNYGISMYEKVSFPGTLGLVLAVMQQPVTVAVEGSSPAFLSYQGGIFSNSTCYGTNGLDHTMLLVGYNLDSSPPYWILKNSWGTNWGEKGFMRMAIEDGDGVCGINVLPGYYPVVKTTSSDSDPCNNWSVGGRAGRVEGRLNPCGGGICQPAGLHSYSCTCKAPFVVGRNIDGSQTCIPSSPCTFTPQNPCRIGTCLDSKSTPGNYTCVCPMGFKLGTKAGDNNPTCVYGTSSQGSNAYAVPDGFQVSCQVVSSAYGVSSTNFVAMNPTVDCTKDIPSGTNLNITSDLGNCTVPYVVPVGENCTSISQSFLPFISVPISGPGTPNPDLDCNSLQAGQLICLVRGPPPPETVCTLPYNIKTNETCDSIINSKLLGNKLLFYSMNPGINCKFVESLTKNIVSPSYQVCLRLGLLGTVMASCSSRRIYTVQAGDTCYRVIGIYYGGSSAKFKSLNGYSCSDSTLDTGDKLCLP